MNFYKYVLAATIAISGVFTSCSSDDDYTPGKPAGSNNVTFICDGTVVLAQTATNFDVTLTRENTSSALEVPLTVIGSEGFTVPASASFASGEAETTITVGVPADMAVNKGYNFEIRIPEEFTNPYKQQDTYPTFKATIMKEDYGVYAEGTYIDNFWYEEAWDATLEFSPSQELYRIKDMFEPESGYHFFFKWNKDTNVLTPTDATGNKLQQCPTPYLYQGSPITGRTDQAKFYYAEEDGEKYLGLPFYWYVPALSGGFGIYECYFVFN